MKMVKFPEATVTYAENQPEYLAAPAHRSEHDETGTATFCWRLTWRERLKLLWRGALWHQVLTFNHPLQPQWLGVDKPQLD